MNYITRLGTGRVLFSLFLVAFGLFLIVYGGYDDSPGGQLFGLILVVFGLARLRRWE